jgi:hypothetical protein
MHEIIAPARNRTIKPAEVMEWFRRGHKPWPSEPCCAEIAERLNKMRWPSDPRLPLPGSSSPDPWWHPETAAARAKALLDDVPAMLWFWQRMQTAPKEWLPSQWDEIELPNGIRKEDIIKQFVPGLRLREGYEAIDQLRIALEAALPYIEFPFGKYERRDHRKGKHSKPWHAHAVAIAPWIAAALRQAGREVYGTSRNTALVRIVREALLRIGYGKRDITVTAVAAHLTRWYSEHDRVL